MRERLLPESAHMGLPTLSSLYDSFRVASRCMSSEATATGAKSYDRVDGPYSPLERAAIYEASGMSDYS